MSKYVTAEEAVKVVQSGNRVYLQAAAAAPTILANALTERASELRDVEICHLHVEGEAAEADAAGESLRESRRRFAAEGFERRTA